VQSGGLIRSLLVVSKKRTNVSLTTTGGPMNDTSTTEGTGRPPVMARTEPHAPLTKQEYYDLLVKSATDGTFPSYDPESKRCRYQGPNGSKCAVGLLIPDSDYDRGFEGWAARALGERFKRKWLPQNMDLEDLQEVQDCHDRNARRGPWNA